MYLTPPMLPLQNDYQPFCSFQPLTGITKKPILDVTKVLDMRLTNN